LASGTDDEAKLREQEAQQSLLDLATIEDTAEEEFRVEANKIIDALHERGGLTQVSSLIKMYREVQPLVTEANMITASMRPEDHLRFQVEVCTDIMTFTKDLPEFIIRLYQLNDDSEREEVRGCFEVDSFKERVEYMRGLYHKQRILGGQSKTIEAEDPWATYSAETIREEVSSVGEEVRQLKEELVKADLDDAAQGGVRQLQEQIRELRKILKERNKEISTMQIQLDSLVPSSLKELRVETGEHVDFRRARNFAPPARDASANLVDHPPDSELTTDPFEHLNLRLPKRPRSKGASSTHGRPKGWKP
jgi:hypothetical protein